MNHRIPVLILGLMGFWIAHLLHFYHHSCSNLRNKRMVQTWIGNEDLHFHKIDDYHCKIIAVVPFIKQTKTNKLCNDCHYMNAQPSMCLKTTKDVFITVIKTSQDIFVSQDVSSDVKANIWRHQSGTWTDMFLCLEDDGPHLSIIR